MLCLRRTVLALAVALLCTHARAQTAPNAAPTAEAIMASVAANQDHAEAARSHYVYVQHAHVVSRKGRTVMCEETTDFRVAPSARGSHAELLNLDGRMLVKQKYVSYNKLLSSKNDDAKDHPANEDKKPDTASASNDKNQKSPAADPDAYSIEITDDSTDRELVENLRANLIRTSSGEQKGDQPQSEPSATGKPENGADKAGADKDQSDKDQPDKEQRDKDGMDNSSLFPLTSGRQKDYAFRLLGRERMNGRDVFHLTFRPKDKNDFGWKGDAYIDTDTCQPVAVSTDMARKVPFAVRTLAARIRAMLAG